MKKILHITVRADLGGGPRHLQYLLDIIKDSTLNYIACPYEEPFYEIYKKQISEENIVQISHRKFRLKQARKLIYFIKKYQIDIIHCHGKGASVYGKFIKLFIPKIKLIYTVHGLRFDNYSPFLNWLNLNYEKITQSLLDKIIYVSDSEAKVAEINKIFQKLDFFVIPNGVPLINQEVDINLIKKKLFPETLDRPIVITLSRYEYQKNMYECLQIAKICTEFNFLWLGDGGDFEKIKEIIDKEHITNIFPYGSASNVFPFLIASDLYLTSSRGEGMPLALLEAISVGLPILASNVVGNKDIVTSEVGDLYTLGNIPDAVNKLRNLMNKPKEKEIIIDYFKNNFSSQVMGERVLEIYNLTEKLNSN